jgi:hypothetical protein
MLDYAANAVVYWPMERIRAHFEAWHGEDTEAILMEFLNPETDDPGADPEVFWEQVKVNLKAGRIRLIFVADKIPSELQRIVEFLNSQMDPAEVLALEVKQYVGQGLKTLVPTIIGQIGPPPPPPPPPVWDKGAFLSKLESTRNAEEAKIASKIIQWAKDKELIRSWGKGKRGSFIPKVEHKGIDYNLFFVRTDGKVELLFAWMKGWDSFKDENKRMQLLQKINEATGANIPLEKINYQPTFSLAVLGDETILNNFLECFDWAIQLIRSS